MPDPSPRPWRDQRLPFRTTQVGVAITVTLDGPRGDGHVGWDVRDLLTGEQILVGSDPFVGARFSPTGVARLIASVIDEAWSLLEPF